MSCGSACLLISDSGSKTSRMSSTCISAGSRPDARSSRCSRSGLFVSRNWRASSVAARSARPPRDQRSPGRRWRAGVREPDPQTRRPSRAGNGQRQHRRGAGKGDVPFDRLVRVRREGGRGVRRRRLRHATRPGPPPPARCRRRCRTVNVENLDRPVVEISRDADDRRRNHAIDRVGPGRRRVSRDGSSSIARALSHSDPTLCATAGQIG